MNRALEGESDATRGTLSLSLSMTVRSVVLCVVPLMTLRLFFLLQSNQSTLSTTFPTRALL